MPFDVAGMHMGLATMLDALPDGVLLVAGDHTIAFANSAAHGLFGYRAGELDGLALSALLPQRYRARHAGQMDGFVTQAVPRVMSDRPVLYALKADASEIPVSIAISILEIDGQRYALASVRDARPLRDHLDQARRRAESDPLTGAGNRTSLRRHAQTLIAASRPFAVLYLDLNGFKSLNDTHGHRIGDQVLRETVRRLMAGVRAGDRLARVGGDEFVVLLSGMHDAELLAGRARSLAEAVARPIETGATVVSVSAAFGGAMYPSHAGDLESLLALADTAMYEAKRQRRHFSLSEPGRE